MVESLMTTALGIRSETLDVCVMLTAPKSRRFRNFLHPCRPTLLTWIWGVFCERFSACNEDTDAMGYIWSEDSVDTMVI